MAIISYHDKDNPKMISRKLTSDEIEALKQQETAKKQFELHIQNLAGILAEKHGRDFLQEIENLRLDENKNNATTIFYDAYLESFIEYLTEQGFLEVDEYDDTWDE